MMGMADPEDFSASMTRAHALVGAATESVRDGATSMMDRHR
jgi:hypothetical protein